MTQHPWRFFRAGGFDQVRLDSGADLLALDSLDQKLWVALACPTSTIDVDARTLKLLDLDGDGRIRAPELIEACKWAGKLLRNADDLLKGAGELPISAIQQGEAEGKAVVDAASAVLKSLGKENAQAISVAEATEAVKALNDSPLNGDGLITEASATDEALRAVIREIIATFGAETDKSGKPGVSQKRIDDFFAELTAFRDWQRAGGADPAILPLGAKTAEARACVRALEAKVDDFFTRCRLAAFDGRAGAQLNRDEKDFAALAGRELSLSSPEIAAFPLARIEPNRALPLENGVNPAWAEKVERLRIQVAAPLLGEGESLTEDAWRTLRAKFEAFDAWMATKKGGAVESLGLARIETLLGSDFQARLTEVVKQDLAVEPVAKSLASVEKLVRVHRDLYRLANNFVSFRDFYARKDKATFQAGTLFIDQRSCDLCIRVEDAGKHATLAPLARTYLVYCDCVRPGEKMTIAAAFTAGDADNLMVGRNGVFYDRQGRDWDATVTKIVDNPISVRQAFWAPYKKVVRFIEEQVAKRASSADSASQARLTSGASELGEAAESGQVQREKPKIDIGIVAALGVAVGGITAALGALLQAFFGLGIWMPIGFVALVLAISGPSMAIAWLKLRHRALAPLLDANGWAMNAPARINIPFGTSLTRLAELPKGAQRELKDPYAEPEPHWKTYGVAAAALVLTVFWFSGRADPYLPEKARKATVFGPKVAQVVPKAAAVGGPPAAATATAPAP